MTQNNNFTQACSAGVNSFGKPDWMSRLGRKIQGYSRSHSAHSLSRGPRPPNSSTPISRSIAAFLIAFALVLSVGSAAHAADDLSKHFEIKAKPLADALMEFGVQSGLTVVAPTTLTAGKRGGQPSAVISLRRRRSGGFSQAPVLPSRVPRTARSPFRRW